MTARSRGPEFTCHPLHARTCTYLPDDVRGRSGDALIRGCNGGDVGDHRAPSPLVGPGATLLGFVGPPWLLLLVFGYFLLVPPCASSGCCLGDTGFPAACVREHTGLSPQPQVMLLWVVPVPVVRVLMHLLWVLVFLVLGSPSP